MWSLSATWYLDVIRAAMNRSSVMTAADRLITILFTRSSMRTAGDPGLINPRATA